MLNLCGFNHRNFILFLKTFHRIVELALIFTHENKLHLHHLLILLLKYDLFHIDFHISKLLC